MMRGVIQQTLIGYMWLDILLQPGFKIVQEYKFPSPEYTWF